MQIKDVVAKTKSNNTVPEIERRARRVLLAKGAMTLLDLANHLNCSPKVAEQILKKLREKKYNVKLKADSVSIEREIVEGAHLVVNAKDFFDGEWFKFGVIGETHLYSKYARLDVLNCLYDIFAREKISTVWHTGNIVDGECHFNRHDLVGPAGFESQAEYLARNYPKRAGIVTRFITGDDHEGWWAHREGFNPGARLQQTAERYGRKDLQWIGHVEADVHLKAPKGQAWMRIMHPGGGSAYAISYTTQKIVESYQGGEKPHILIVGHYHKFDYGYPREVHTLQPGCVQDQTPFLRKLKIQAHVGGCIVRFHQSKTGEISRFNVEWIPFYDRGFYERLGKYRRW